MVRSRHIAESHQSEESENSSSSIHSIIKTTADHGLAINGNEAMKTRTNKAGRLQSKTSANSGPSYKEYSSEDEYIGKNNKSKRNRKKIIESSNDDEPLSNNQDLSSASEEDIDFFSKPVKAAKTNGRKHKVLSSDEDANPKKKRNRMVRKVRKKYKEEETSPSKPKSSSRKAIRHVLKRDQLKEETKDAEKQEKERRKRLKNLKDDKIIEVDMDKSIDTALPVRITKRLVLQKKPLVEVHPEITVHLKPHQVEGVQFIWDNMVETTADASKKNGGGCILAHCMGLGKTLQTITVVHTILHSKHLDLKTVLVVAPLNTLLNWIDELTRWAPEEQPLTLYNLNEYSTVRARLQVLKTWAKDGGVLVMGYDMFRLLASGCRISHKAKKETLAQLLLDPGPDIIVCDEGHKLKNSASNISLVMSKIKTARRLVLTGTPLQNNLMEYQCMVNFVKPNLLGSGKEFRNRFVNPIQNGQHSDSTEYDVRLMKKRCHILHNMLQGFVQRKDYTALAEYLCGKLEFVIKVRLTPLQNKLYRHYLDTQTNRGANQQAIVQGSRDTGLFADYQNLMRVWTHPRVLQLHSIRQEHLNQFVIDDSSDEAVFESDDEEEWKSEDESRRTEDETRRTDNEARRTEDAKEPISIEESDEESSVSSTSQEEEDEEEADDSDDSLSSVEEVRTKTRPCRRRRGRYGLRGGDRSDAEIERQEAEAEARREANKLENNSWYSSILKEHSPQIDDPAAGGKIATLFEILRLAREFDDKVLVFSQSLLSLDMIEEMLSLSTMRAVSQEEATSTNSPSSPNEDPPSGTAPVVPDNDTLCQKWYKNVDYFRMDGSSLSKWRQKWINEFNDESDRRARLFLISTKAGSLGVNLVAANRVVIFDASWNPTHDIQSIFRVYRFGQSKSCYIYRLIAQGTMEEKIYDRQVAKQSLSFRVVDEQQINRHFTANDLQELYTFTPSVPNPDDKRLALPKDKLLAEMLVGSNTKHLISSYHAHDSLLDHQEEEELTEEERKAAWEEYENEKKGIRPNSMINSKSLHQLALNEQFRLQQRLHEQEKLQKIAAQLQASGKLPQASSIEAQSQFLIVVKAMELVHRTEKRLQDLQPLDFPEAISNLRKLPMYQMMKEDSLKMLAVELKIRRQQLRLTAEKDYRQAKMQLEFLSARYARLVQPSSGAASSASDPSTSFLHPSNLSMLQHQEHAAVTDNTILNGMLADRREGFASLSSTLLHQRASAAAGMTTTENPAILARAAFADMLKTDGLTLAGASLHAEKKEKPASSESNFEDAPIVIDSDREPSPINRLEADALPKSASSNTQPPVVNPQKHDSKSTYQNTNKPSTSKVLPAIAPETSLENVPIQSLPPHETGSSQTLPVFSNSKPELSHLTAKKRSAPSRRKKSRNSSYDDDEAEDDDDVVYNEDTSEEEDDDWEAKYLKKSKLQSRRAR